MARTNFNVTASMPGVARSWLRKALPGGSRRPRAARALVTGSFALGLVTSVLALAPTSPTVAAEEACTGTVSELGFCMDPRTRTGFRAYATTQALVVYGPDRSYTLDPGESTFVAMDCSEGNKYAEVDSADRSRGEVHELGRCPITVAETAMVPIASFRSGPGTVVAIEGKWVSWKTPAFYVRMHSTTRLRDPEGVVAGVDVEYELPGGGQTVAVAVRGTGSSGDLLTFTTGSPYQSWSNICGRKCLGAWVARTVAYNSAGEVLSVKERTIEVKDYTEIRPPRVVSVRPVGPRVRTTTRRFDRSTQTAELRGTFVVKVRDPDKVLIATTGALRSRTPKGRRGPDSWRDNRIRRRDGYTFHRTRMRLAGELGCHTISLRRGEWYMEDWYGILDDGSWRYGPLKGDRAATTKLCFERP